MTSDGHMITSTMHGLQVIKTFNTPQKSGAIMVALGKEALFSFSYNGITEDEAVTLAEKFDWKAIQAAAQTKYRSVCVRHRLEDRERRVAAWHFFPGDDGDHPASLKRSIFGSKRARKISASNGSSKQ